MPSDDPAAIRNATAQKERQIGISRDEVDKLRKPAGTGCRNTGINARPGTTRSFKCCDTHRRNT